MANEITYRTPDQLPVMDAVGETTHALVEDGGQLKRVPGSLLGGSGGIKTAIIKDSSYDNALAGIAPAGTAAPALTYDCISMTYDEAMQTIMSGEPLGVMLMASGDGLMMIPGFAVLTSMDGGATFFIAGGFNLPSGEFYLFWTADGISTDMPGSR